MQAKQKIIHLIYSYPKHLICFLTLIIAACSIGVTKLELEYSQKSWFRDGDPLLENFNQFKDKYGSDISLITILNFKENVFSPNNMQRAYAITEEFWNIPNFVRIDSLTNYSYTTTEEDEIIIEPFIKDPNEKKWSENYLTEKRIQAKKLKPIQNYLISDDQKSIAIYGSFKHVEGRESGTFKKAVADVRANIIDKYEADDLKIMLTGPAFVGTSFQEESIKDFKFLIPLGFAILFIFLLIVFKNLLATVLSLGLIAITLITMLGVQGWLGIRMGVVTGMCPLIVLAICVADAVHIFSTYFTALENGEKDPLKYSLQKNLGPTFLTTLTTTVGFLALTSAELYPIVDKGIVASVGITSAWIFTIFILCPLLKLIPIKKQFLVRKQILALNFNPIHSFILKYPVHIVSFVFILSGLSFYYSSQNTIDSNMLNYFSEKSPFRKATDFFEQKIGGTESIELILESGKEEGIKDPQFLNKVDQFEKLLYKIPDVTKVNSILSPLKEVNQVLNNGKEEFYTIADSQAKIAQELFFLELSLPPTKNLNNLISNDKKDLRVSVYWKRSSSAEIMAGTKHIEKLMQEVGLNGYVTGTVPLISGLDGYIVKSFFESMTVAIILIAILMMVVFKSIPLGLFSMIPNIIVPSFGAAALYIFGISFDAGSVLLFSICLGIAIDDTIFFLTNFEKSMKKHHVLPLALKDVLNNTGNTLTYTTLILVSVFGLFYLGSFIPNKNFAIATSIILSSALILDLVFLPALLIVFRKIQLKFPRRT